MNVIAPLLLIGLPICLYGLYLVYFVETKEDLPQTKGTGKDRNLKYMACRTVCKLPCSGQRYCALSVRHRGKAALLLRRQKSLSFS